MAPEISSTSANGANNSTGDTIVPVNLSTSLNLTLNLFSPLARHHNDNPAVAIILDPFNGSNFVLWSHAVKRGLSVKNKLALIDGSLHQPKEEDDRAIFLAWTRANDLVLMWILNSIHGDIKKSLEYFTTAKSVWDELHARYAKSDGTRFYQSEKSISGISKGNQSLVSYYNSFKALWDEILSYRPMISCTCGVKYCTCDLPRVLAKIQERDCVMKFLIGLDDSYSIARSQILMQTFLPSLAKTYFLLLQEKSQRALTNHMPNVDGKDFVAMLVRNNAKFYKDKKEQ